MLYYRAYMSIIELKPALIQATFSPNRAISRDVEGIELGVFDGLSRELIDKTMRDPQRRENVYDILVTPNERVFINKEALQGEAMGATRTYKFQFEENFFGDKRLRQNMFIGSAMHSHPYDFPPSPTDMLCLMYSDAEIEAATSVIVVTPARRIALFRGSGTPQLSPKDADARVRLWNSNLDERISSFQAATEADSIDLNKRAQDAQINQIAIKYEIAVFSAPLSESILRRGLL